MPSPTCVQCEAGYQRIKEGVYLVEMFNAPPQPYKIWHADLWKCPGCSTEITSGYGQNAIMEHFQEGFDEEKSDMCKECNDAKYDFEDKDRKG